MAHALQTNIVENVWGCSQQQATEDLCAAIRACGSEEAFATSADEMRSAREVQADMALNLAPLLSSMGPRFVSNYFSSILDGFPDGEDTSRFALMNAVTAVAREIPDPELRWRLEEYGGGVAVGMLPRPERFDASARSLSAVWDEQCAERHADLYSRDLQLQLEAVA